MASALAGHLPRPGRAAVFHPLLRSARALRGVAVPAASDHVLRRVCAAARHRKHMIEFRGFLPAVVAEAGQENGHLLVRQTDAAVLVELVAVSLHVLHHLPRILLSPPPMSRLERLGVLAPPTPGPSPVVSRVLRVPPTEGLPHLPGIPAAVALLGFRSARLAPRLE